MDLELCGRRPRRRPIRRSTIAAARACSRTRNTAARSLISARRFSQSAAERTFAPLKNVNGSGRVFSAGNRRDRDTCRCAAILGARRPAPCWPSRFPIAWLPFAARCLAAARARSTADSSVQMPRTSPVAEEEEGVAFAMFCCSMNVFNGMGDAPSYPARITSPHIVLSLVPLLFPLLQ